MRRKSIGKKLRFEIYKRDKFTCQYCGRKAPDVILEIDHIDPVANGGDNNILNLITSCIDCNRGKSNIPLAENVILEKQRIQLEQLEERREQIEMLFEWRKSLDNLKEYTDELLIQYVESKIHPYTLNDNGKSNIAILAKKFDINDIFLAIDKSENVYLKYDNNNELVQESVENFINKIGGIIINSKRSPIDSKIHYIKGICRNRFSYWNDKVGIIVLKNYVKALQDQGWTEDQIISDLENDVTNISKTSRNWTVWKNQMESWVEDIKNWSTSGEEEIALEVNELEELTDQMVRETQSLFELIKFLNKLFDGTDEIELFNNIVKSMKEYVDEQANALQSDSSNISNLKPSYSLCREMHFFDCLGSIDSHLKYQFDNMYRSYMVTWVNDNFYLPSLGITNKKDIVLFKLNFEKEMNKTFVNN